MRLINAFFLGLLIWGLGVPHQRLMRVHSKRESLKTLKTQQQTSKFRSRLLTYPPDRLPVPNFTGAPRMPSS